MDDDWSGETSSLEKVEIVYLFLDMKVLNSVQETNDFGYRPLLLYASHFKFFLQYAGAWPCRWIRLRHTFLIQTIHAFRK